LNSKRPARPDSPASSRQAGHYDTILEEYDRHYYDVHSSAYRRRFILDPLLAGLDLRHARVADLASGSGYTSLDLIGRFPGVQMTGFDISPVACERYARLTKCPARLLDLTKGYREAERFDAAIVMGGLHHCVADLRGAIETVATMLKPGGRFMMFEPNSQYALQFARRLWYRFDKYFDGDTENGLAHSHLLNIAGPDFRSEWTRYFGGPAFFVVYNSLIFRLGGRVKGALAGPLLAMESGYNALPGRFLFSSFLARWIRC
jgi:SAM-dependent methyltransferase